MGMKKGRNIFVGAMFDETTYALMKDVAIRTGVDISDFVRMAVRKELARLSLLGEEDARILGVKE